MSPKQLAERKRTAILSAVSDAAERGAVCPTSEELGRIVGYCPQSIREAFRQLKASGLISYFVRGNIRVVTVTATGKTTSDYALCAERFVQPARPKVTVREIVDMTAAVFDLTRRDILGRTKLRHITRARQAVCIVGARHGWGPSHIGRVIDRDHTTVGHARDMAGVFAKYDATFAARLDALDTAVRERCAA